MSTETNPTPAVATPYEPREPLPGVAPAIRCVGGGYVREDAHPGADAKPPERGDGCWHGEKGHPCALDERDALRAERDEALQLLCAERGETLDLVTACHVVLGDKHSAESGRDFWKRTAEASRDSLRAEVERLKADPPKEGTPFAVYVTDSTEPNRPIARFEFADMATLWAAKNYPGRSRVAADPAPSPAPASSEDARETAGNAPPRDERPPDAAAPVTSPVVVPAPGQELAHPSAGWAGFWRCEECGEANDSKDSGVWRFNGRILQHYCPGRHPQAGPADAKRMDAPASTGTGGEETAPQEREDAKPQECVALQATPGGHICCRSTAPCRVHACSAAICQCRDGNRWAPIRAEAVTP